MARKELDEAGLSGQTCRRLLEVLDNSSVPDQVSWPHELTSQPATMTALK
jgi:hypothetical protein